MFLGQVQDMESLPELAAGNITMKGQLRMGESKERCSQHDV